MTFEELDAEFPNGFDDAQITNLTLDYQNRTATIQLNLRLNLPNGPNSQEYGRGVLIVRGFYYVLIEPPDIEHLFYPSGSKITVDGLSEDETTFPLFERLKPTLPAGAFCCRLFVHDWNAFIRIAAKDAEFSSIGTEH
jgi:hypothetical protein